MTITEHHHPHAGRPRNEQIDRAVLQVAAEMSLTTPYGELSLASIAAHAHTTRAAIARRWPSKAHVVIDAFVADAARLSVEDTGSLRGDLEAFTRQNAELFSSPRHRGLTLAALATLGDLGLEYGGMPQPRADTIGAIFQRAAERGDLPTHAQPAIITQLLAGSVLFRAVILNQPIESAMIVELVTAVLNGDEP